MRAAEETKLPARVFPQECPYTVAEVLSQDFLPSPPWVQEVIDRD